jgi:hypothetical protein
MIATRDSCGVTLIKICSFKGVPRDVVVALSARV